MLLYFIIGVLFAYIGTIVLENLSSIISAFSQYIIHIFALKITKIKKEMQDLGLEDQEEEGATKIPMGFHSDLIGTEVFQQEEEEENEQQEEQN